MSKQIFVKEQDNISKSDFKIEFIKKVKESLLGLK
jgi:hypothetical protein